MAAYFDSWRTPNSEVVVKSEWQCYCPYSLQTLPLVLPSAVDASLQVVLPLFGAASASPSGTGLVTGPDGSLGAPGSSSSVAVGSSLSKAESRDVILNAGGPVWAMDWCPAGSASTGSSGATADDASAGPATSATRAAAEGTCDYLAVSCHPLQAQHNVIGALLQGPACIQVWQLSNPEPPTQPSQQRQQQQQQKGKQQQAKQQPQLQLPRMVLALAHDSGLAWHCQWCPDASLADNSSPGNGDMLPRLGLLAAALGDGSVRIWPVPQPHAAAQQLDPAAASATTPLVLSVPPVAVIGSAVLGSSLPCVLDWLPAPPYDLLAVGCWDGTVALFKLVPGAPTPTAQHNGGLPSAGGQQQQGAAAVGGHSGSSSAPGSGSSSSSMYGLELLSHFSADALPLRALRWVPPSVCGDTIDLLHRQVLLTAGHEGCLRIWDLRDPFQPLYSHVLSSNSTILSADWTARPFGLLVAMEDASLRGIVLDSTLINRATEQEKKAMFSVTWRGLNMGALWSLAVHQGMQLVAYGGENGELGVFSVEYEANSRRRMPHTAIAALRIEGGALVLKSRQELDTQHGLFSGKVMERMPNLAAARLPDEKEALHRVAWSRHDGSAGAWLASGGASGIVRVQWIKSK